MAATYFIIAAFFTVTGLVSAQEPFGPGPEYGIGDIGFGNLGEAGAFTHGFGPFPGAPFPPPFPAPYPGITPHPISWSPHVSIPTHTVTHTSGVSVPHHVSTHVGGSTTTKTVTVTHHPGSHVTTVHHPATPMATHVQHVNYGSGFPVGAPLLPMGYGPGPYPVEPYPYGMGHPMSWPTFGGVGGTTHTVTHTPVGGVTHHVGTHGSTTTKTVTVTHHPSSQVTHVTHHPAPMVTSHVNVGAGFPGGFGYGHGFLAPPGITHQTFSHGFPGPFPGGMYDQFPGVGYGFDTGMPFPYIHDGSMGMQNVHTVHHHHPGGVTTHTTYPHPLTAYPMGNPYPYGSTTTVTKHTKTVTHKAGSGKKN
uniref:Suckerin-17 n=1 Tax=Dosidicus gigas TaxID=346249 RepID=A0A081DU73_DOSGI